MSSMYKYIKEVENMFQSVSERGVCGRGAEGSERSVGMYHSCDVLVVDGLLHKQPSGRDAVLALVEVHRAHALRSGNTTHTQRHVTVDILEGEITDQGDFTQVFPNNTRLSAPRPIQ